MWPTKAFRQLVRPGRDGIAYEGARLHRGHDRGRIGDGARPSALRTPVRAANGRRGGRADCRPPARAANTLADRHIRADRNCCSARSDLRQGPQDHGMEEQGDAILSTAQPRRRCADRLGLSLRNQHAPGPPGAGGPVRWRRGERYGQPGRKVKGDWDAWNARSLTDEPIIRLILDGTVVRVRLDKKSTSISLLVALGVRQDGQKVLLAVKNMGGESEAAWRTLLDDLVKRGLKGPELVIVDGAPGIEKALAGLWPDVLVQRCTVHKHRNLLAHAPERLHDELSADYKDMIYADTKQEVETKRKAFWNGDRDRLD